MKINMRKDLEKPKEKLSLERTQWLLEHLRQMYYHRENTENGRKAIKKMARIILYDASETRQANYVSKKANNLCKSVCNNLFYLTPPKQRTLKEKIPQLAGIILEHCNTLSFLLEKIFDKKGNIKSILKRDLLTAWITKEEDEDLNKNGYRNKRPGGWDMCYYKCKIALIPGAWADKKK